MKTRSVCFLIALLIGFMMVTSGCKDNDDKTQDVNLTSITVTPHSNPVINQGATQQFTANGTYSDGSTSNITTKVAWASSNTAVAAIAAGGVATAKTPGDTGITASLNGVTSAGETLTVNLSTNILMGKVISDPTHLESDFNDTVQAIKIAVNQFSYVPENSTIPVKPWKVAEEQDMSFPAGRHGKLIEVSAPSFAAIAMSMGQHHALGMPCKIGVWTEDSDADGNDDLIKINTLDEAALFAFFFADVISNPQFGPFASMISSHIKSIAQSAITALNGVWIYERQAPFFTKGQMETVQTWAASGGGGYNGANGYATLFEVPLAGNDGGQSAQDFLDGVKNKIISAIGTTPYSRDDWQVVNADFDIPVTDSQFAKIKEIKIHSPYYDQQLADLGGKYIVALPYTISVWLNDLAPDGTHQTPDKVTVGILNPGFMLTNFLKDASANVPLKMSSTADEIKNQILAMVNRGLQDYTIPNTSPRPQPRLSTSILMGKISIAGTSEADAFAEANLAVKNAVAAFGVAHPFWMVVEEKTMPFPGGRYGKLVEIGNPAYAALAMTMGQHHALGVPCRIGIWTEDENDDGNADVVKINTFDEAALFNFYFADVMSATNFDDLASTIKNDTKQMVKNAVTALEGKFVFEHQAPFFNQEELAVVKSWAIPGNGGYAGALGYGLQFEVPLDNKGVGQTDQQFLDEVKSNIISAIDVAVISDVQEDWHVINPDFDIAVGTYPPSNFASIGEIKLCSGHYASQIVGLGGKYMIALPCNISVWLNDLAENGSPKTPDKVIVSVLKPDFVLGNFFKDLPTLVFEGMAPMGGIIKGELLDMVNEGLKDYTGVVPPPE